MTLSQVAAFRKDKGKLADLQHRHFATIATIVSELDDAIRVDVAKHFANRLSSTNPKFDRERFLRATQSRAA